MKGSLTTLIVTEVKDMRETHDALPAESGQSDGATTLLCFAVLSGALWTMKKISESVRGEKLSWKDFLFPHRGQEITTRREL